MRKPDKTVDDFLSAGYSVRPTSYLNAEFAE
jgi:hypothetical protein